MKKKFTLFIASGLLAGSIAFTSCDNKNENSYGEGDRNYGTTGTGSGTGLNSDVDNNSTTGAIDPGQEQYEKENQSHYNNASTSSQDTMSTTSNTGTRVGPTGGHHSTGSPATTGQTSRGAGNPGHTTQGNQQDHSTR